MERGAHLSVQKSICVHSNLHSGTGHNFSGAICTQIVVCPLTTTKHLVLLSLFVLGGCAAQSKTVFIADLENLCSYPVDITAYAYSNAKEPFVLNKRVAPGDVVEVLSYISFADDLENSVPDTYRLDITANGNSLSLDKPRFLAQLGRSHHERRGNSIHAWKIRDTALCP